MKNIQREDIHLFSRHSTLTEQGIDRALRENVYPARAAWQKFMRLLLVSLGVGFTVSGIVFFFAYNWADLHKFAKFGLIQGLLIGTTAFALVPRFSVQTRQLMLTGASVLVGVLFAVFGQIYQTGANAYDFFLVWTVFITLWVIISNFAPLWLLFLLLVNTTFILYSHQVARDWSPVLVCTVLFVFHTVALVASLSLIPSKNPKFVPSWFLNILALTSQGYAVIGITVGIFATYEHTFLLLIVLVLPVSAAGIRHGLRTKSGFYLSLIPFGIIMIISALLLKMMMYLLLSVFIIVGVTLLVKILIALQKKWAHEG